MLIERMRVSYREELERQLEIYPSTISYLVEELTTKRFYTELTYESITTLVSYLGVADCNPLAISEVFDNH
jgi:hypothetical protein